MEKENKKIETKASPEQVIYADILFYGSWFAIAIMLVTYFLYLIGIVDPHIPIKEIPSYWSQNAHHYTETAKIPLGWGWLSLIGKGDFINFIGIVLLAMMTILGFISLIPAYIKKKDNLFTAIVIAEILVLIFAASGIVGGGGH